MLYLRYMGEFLSRAGVRWRVELLQEAEEAFAEVGVLEFDADEAVVIEWDERSKEEVVCGSMATLSIISPGDRTYADLYTETPGSIRMDVYREDVLYWCGLLDAEFYEEPYEMAKGYVVSLKFSDFGAMERMKWRLSGMPTVRECVVHCIEMLGLPLELDESLMSCCLAGSDVPMGLDGLTVRADNFYDEDGESSSLEEVVEGVLQPLALRMVQRAGRVWVYDLNGLYTMGGQADIVWDGATQTMGVDRVYNNATVTWSPYAQSGNLLPEKCWVKDTDKNVFAMNWLNGREVGDCVLWSYHYSTEIADWIDLGDCGFTMWTATEGKNGRLMRPDAVRWFKFVPQYDGQDAEGVAISWTGVAGVRQSYNGGYSDSFSVVRKGVHPSGLAGTIDGTGVSLFRSQEVWLPPTDDGQRLMIRVCIEMLMDPRFNPHEQAVNWSGYMDQKNWQETWRTYGNYVYVPVTIKFQPDGEDVVYCWDNRDVVGYSTKYGVRTVEETKGKWVVYETAEAGSDDQPKVWGLLNWYDPSDRVDSCGVANGWRVNRPAINPHRKELTTALEQCDDGQYIPYPMNGGGRMWIEVRYGGWMICNENDDIKTGMSSPNNPHGLWGLGNDVRGPRMNWVLMKLPKVEILNNMAFDQEILSDDVEYKAELNGNAKEGIEIETVCGTCADGKPTARGAYFETVSGRLVRELTRAGRTTQVEELLIGTLYSQFSRRMTRLEGEALILCGGMTAYREANQEGRLFLAVRDEQNLIRDVSDVSVVEFRPDEFSN